MGLFSSSETLGKVTTTIGPTGWAIQTDLKPRFMSLAFFHYLERVLHTSGSDKGMDLLVGISDQLQKRLGTTDTARTVAERGSAADLMRKAVPFPIEMNEKEWHFDFTMHRKKDRGSPDGLFHYATADTRPRLGDFELMTRIGNTSAAMVYERAYNAGDKHIRLFMFRTLSLALMLYKPDAFGLPSVTTIGKVPNMAPFMFFGFALVDAITPEIAATSMRDYLGGKDIPNELWGQ